MPAEIFEFKAKTEPEPKNLESEQDQHPHGTPTDRVEEVIRLNREARAAGEPEIFAIRNIREQVEQNWWKSERFEDRVRDVASVLEVDPEVIRESIESAITPEILVKVKFDEKDQSLVEALNQNRFDIYYLLRLLHERGYDISVWTMGDEAWQRRKLQLSGADKFVAPDHVFISEGDKTDKLREIIKINLKEKSSPIHIYVVDDNRDRLQQALALNTEYETKDVYIHDYQIKIHDKNADGTAFYKWITAERAKNPNLILVMDFDQTIADTDGALSGIAVENIYAAKMRGAKPKSEYKNAA